MVYECPQCKSPLPPGAMSCARCGLQFATAIPADATLPAASGGTAYEETTGYGGPAEGSGPSKKVLAVVAALVIVLVAIAAFAVYTFSQTPSPAPVATLPLGPTPGQGTPYSRPQGALSEPNANPSSTSLAPVTLPTGTGGTAAAQTGDASVVGRWRAKNMDYYQFNSDGTGARGSLSGGRKSESFSWVVNDNQITLSAKREEKLAFNSSPDNNTLYLRLPSGVYTQFQRADSR